MNSIAAQQERRPSVMVAPGWLRHLALLLLVPDKAALAVANRQSMLRDGVTEYGVNRKLVQIRFDVVGAI